MPAFPMQQQVALIQSAFLCGTAAGLAVGQVLEECAHHDAAHLLPELCEKLHLVYTPSGIS